MVPLCADNVSGYTKDVVILDEGLSNSHLKKSGSKRVKRVERASVSAYIIKSGACFTQRHFNSYMFEERNIIT